MNNDERRELNRRILNETLDYIHSDEYLSASVCTSMAHLEFFPSEKIVECERGKFEHPATVVVSRKRTASALYESGYGGVMLSKDNRSVETLQSDSSCALEPFLTPPPGHIAESISRCITRPYPLS